MCRRANRKMSSFEKMLEIYPVLMTLYCNRDKPEEPMCILTSLLRISVHTCNYLDTVKFKKLPIEYQKPWPDCYCHILLS